MKHTDLRDRLKPYLEKSGKYPAEVIDQFLECCFYQSGKSYGDDNAYKQLASMITKHEDELENLTCHVHGGFPKITKDNQTVFERGISNIDVTPFTGI